MKQGVRAFGFLALGLALISFVTLPSLDAFGQDISGNVVGTVLDASGAAVVGADVEATNAGTNITTRTKTNNTGEYRVDNLLPGTYRINVRATGFKSFVQNVDVLLNKTGTLNITLTPGAASETVEVSGAPPIIDTTTAQLQSTYETLEVANVPTASVGLGVINLSLLQAGVGSTGGLGAGTGPAVGGQRPRDNNYTIEGVDNNDKGVTGPIIYVPNDAVENFTIIQNQFSPEFGHSAGGQFNTSVKSGTNAFHGTAYEYFQNRNLNAIDNLVLLSTDPGTSPKRTRFDNNRFGGQIGGPIIKNKAFFFVNYEYNPIGQTAIPAAIQAPTAAGYATAMSLPGISTTNLQALQKWAVAPTAAGSLDICSTAPNPDATCAGGTTAIETGNLLIQAPNWNNFGALTTSGDLNISDRDQLRVRYIYNKNKYIDTAAALPAFYIPFSFPYHLANVAEFHSFGTNLSNEFRIGFHRSAQFFTIPNQTFLPSLTGFPNLTFDDLGGINVGPDPNAPQYAVQNLYQMIDNVSWIKANHTLKFGFEARKHISPQKFIQRSRGDYEYPQFGDFAWDLAPSQDGGFAERSFGNVGYSGDQYGLYGYVNDIWKVRPNISLNMGLRYEYTSTPYGWTQQSLNSVANDAPLITFGSPQAPTKNFMPRIGFAYSPGRSGNMSIRGGFGIAYDVLYDNIGVLSRPPQIGSTIDCPTACTTGGVGGGSGFLANGGIPVQPLSGITVLNQADARASTSSYLPNHVKYPYAESWNLGVSRVFHTNYTGEVRYVGSRGVNLNVQNRLNVVNTVNSSNALPFFLNCDATCTALGATNTSKNLTNLINAEDNGAYIDTPYLNDGFFSEIVGFMPFGASTYHGLQAQLDRRFASGLYIQAAYTFSKLIDNSTADFFSTIIAPRRPQDFRNLPAERSNSVLDHRNRFTLSMVYDTQWFKHSTSWLARNVLSGYEIAPVYIYETGQWGTVQSGRDVNLNTDSAGDRVIVNPSGIRGRGSDVTDIVDPAGDVVGYFANDPTAQYIRGGSGVIVNGSRSTLQSPAINNLDFTIAKTVHFTERYSLRFQMQALNSLNHPQYTTGSINQANGISDTGGAQRNVLIPSSGNLESQQIGLLNFPNGVFNQWRSAFGSNARVVQLGAKFIF